MTVDTPILDDAIRALIVDTQEIHSRLKRARDFTRYLERQAEHFTDADVRRVLSDIFTAVANDITDIEQELGRT